MILTATDYERLRPAAEVFAMRLAKEFRASLGNRVGLPQGAHSISWRVKPPSAIARKIAATRESGVNDYIGVRVLCAHLGLIQNTSRGVTLAARTAGLVAVRSQQWGSDKD